MPLAKGRNVSTRLSNLKRAWSWSLSRVYRRIADAHRHFGNLYANREEHWAAVEHYTRAIVLDPSYVEALYSRGVLYWREIGNHYRAIQDLSQVLELDPSRAEAYFNRGLAYKLRRQPQKAIKDFESYLAEGTDAFWLDAAHKQLLELREDLAQPGTEEPGETEP
jgi:tetratricopeptide (TPR) repeat protein